MALTVCSLSPVSVTPYYLLESLFQVHSFGSLHTPFPFFFLLMSRSRTSSSMLNSWRWGSLVLLRLLNTISAGLTLVVGCGVLGYITKKLSISDFQLRPSALVIRRRFRILRSCLSISPLTCGNKGVVRLCSIPFSSKYFVKWSLLVNCGPLSVLKDKGRS